MERGVVVEIIRRGEGGDEDQEKGENDRAHGRRGCDRVGRRSFSDINFRASVRIILIWTAIVGTESDNERIVLALLSLVVSLFLLSIV